jgi:ribosome-interacting GTPase 1
MGAHPLRGLSLAADLGYNRFPEDAMPANLPPEYHKIESELRTARDPREKIDIYERLIAVIPHHKGTDKLIAMYRQKIAKAREEMARRPAAAKHGPGHKVEKSGAGQVVLVGPPNAGKSLLVKGLTGAEPEVADYPFTTRLPAPYMMPFENVQVQLIDTPPVTADDMETWFPEMVKMADAVLLVADLADPADAGLLDGIMGKLKERKIELVPGDTLIPPERFPFVKRAAIAANKLDAGGAASRLEELGTLLEASIEKIPVSALTGRGLEDVRRAVFRLLHVIRVYSKVPGKKADREAPFALRKGITVLEMARAVHKDFAEKLAFARVWSKDGSLEGLRVTRDYVIADEDIVELHI